MEAFINITLMQCPLCKQLSVILQDRVLVCQQPDCHHIDLHPMSYAPEVITSKDDDLGPSSNQLYCHALAPHNHQDSVLKKMRRIINDACHVLKYSDYVGKLALTIAIQSAVKEFGEAYTTLLMNEDLEGKENGFRKNSSIVTKKKLAAFGLYVACHHRQFLLEEYRIAKYFRYSYKHWKQILSHFNQLMKSQISNLPPIRSAPYLVKKMCQARGINQEETEAMVEMCQRMESRREFRPATVACISFWKMCQYSKRYSKEIKLESLCRAHHKIYESNEDESLIEKYFDITAQTVRNSFKDHFEKHFISKLLLKWSQCLIGEDRELLEDQ